MTKIACKVLILCSVVCLSSIGCSDSDADPKGGSAGSSGEAGAAGSTASEGIYGIGSLVSGQDTSNDYLLLVPTLDHQGEKLNLEDGREFSGQSDLAAYDGSLLVSSGDAPEIVKYEVDDNRSLNELEKVSFASYGLASAAFWNNQFVSSTKAYMLNGAAEVVVWNPETMRVEGTIELPELEPREGLKVVAALADRASVVHDGKYYLPLYWTDEQYALRSDDSVILVIDTATDTVEDTISAPCPGLDYGTVDDDGLLHFSNWTGGAGTHYVLGTAANCVATLDPATKKVTTRSFASITGGHEGAAFKYAGNGKFVLSVFDEVRADIENAEDPFTPVGGLNWQLWSYDPATGDAAPIEGVDWNSGAIIQTVIDDQLYSMVPGEAYASTVTYKIDGNTAEPMFGITGWSFRMFKVR